MYHKVNSSLGLTLPELLPSVCVSLMLLSFAVPSFVKVIANNRMTSIANQMVTALNYARSEAVKRGLQVSVRHKDNTPRIWDKGWDVFIDNNGNGTMDLADTLLKSYDEVPEGYTLRTGNNIADLNKRRGGTDE